MSIMTLLSIHRYRLLVDVQPDRVKYNTPMETFLRQYSGSAHLDPAMSLVYKSCTAWRFPFILTT